MFNVLSYNILNPWHAHHWQTPEGLAAGKCNWQSRKHQLLENLISVSPAVICLQEVNVKTTEELEELLTEQGYVLAMSGAHDPIAKNNATKLDASQYHGVAQFYKPSIKLRSARVVSYASGTVDSRAAVWSVYAVAGLRVGVLTLHLSGYNLEHLPTSAAAALGVKEMATFAAFLELELTKKGPAAFDLAIVMGDFNCNKLETSPRFHALTKLGFTTAPIGAPTCREWEVDWGFVWQREGVNLCVKTSIPNILHPNASDHLPVLLELSYSSS